LFLTVSKSLYRNSTDLFFTVSYKLVPL